MSDTTLTHDATDWKRKLDELRSTGARAPSCHVDALGGEAANDTSGDALQSANPDLASRIELALRETGYTPLRNLHILAAGGIAILRGAVPSYYMKQIAQSAASGVVGIIDVHNELDVVPPDTNRNSGPI